MIYITGDTHGSIDIRKLNMKNFPEQKQMTKNDYVIIAGDFGVIWDNSKEQTNWLKWLESRNFTTLFICGNHENFDLINEFPVIEWNGGKVHQVNASIYHLMRGQIFTIENQKIFTFGGAESIDKGHRQEFKSWWRQEIPTQEEFNEGIKNLQKHNMNVDIVLTHTAPTQTIISHLDKEKINDPTCKMLDEFEQLINYKHWYHGHFHTDQTIDKFTAIYNKIKCLGL